MREKCKHFMSTVKVGSKGQIVIPKEIRDMFSISEGDNLIIMADTRRGIALQKSEVMSKIAEAIFAGRGKEIYPGDDPANINEFADAIKETVEKEEQGVERS